MRLKQSVSNWLGIRDYSKELENSVKEYKDITNKLESEMWKHRQVLKDKVTKECPVCHKGLTVWPLESEAYYQLDGNVYHTACYDKRVK